MGLDAALHETESFEIIKRAFQTRPERLDGREKPYVEKLKVKRCILYSFLFIIVDIRLNLARVSLEPHLRMIATMATRSSSKHSVYILCITRINEHTF